MMEDVIAFEVEYPPFRVIVDVRGVPTSFKPDKAKVLFRRHLESRYNYVIHEKLQNLIIVRPVQLISGSDGML